VQAIFYHKLFIPTHPLHHWNIFNGVEFQLEKNIIATKMKENG